MIDKAVRRAELLLTKQFNVSCKIYQAKCEDVTKCVNGKMQQLSASFTKNSYPVVNDLQQYMTEVIQDVPTTSESFVSSQSQKLDFATKEGGLVLCL